MKTVLIPSLTLTLTLTLAAALVLSACSTTEANVDARALHGITPSQAVQMAAASAPRGVLGVFKVHVSGSGEQHGQLYLNSEADYRDQRNISLEIAPVAAQQLGQLLGADPRAALQGKDLLVAGVAERVVIYFYEDGRQTDKYYYQTHVRVTDPQQIVIQ